MKKNRTIRWPGTIWHRKIGKVMKLLVFLLTLGCLSVSARTLAQQQRVTLNLRNCTVMELFQAIQQQTDLFFVYNYRNFEHIGKLEVQAQDEEVYGLLKRLFGTSKLDFVFDDQTVIVKPQVAEKVVVQGIVRDKNKFPLPGVTIVIKGTTIGVTTYEDGRFQLVLPSPQATTLVFSFVGMKTKEVVWKGEPELQITMEEETTQMGEVVITGYQTVDRRKSTSSVTSVKMEDLNIPGVSSIDQMLQGRIPDLILMSNSGEVGVVPKLRIRGTSTLIGNREPLWVLDGIIMQDPVDVPAADLNDPDYINRVGNAIAGINPQDIERIDVLKDAAATALYGTRAANGVIVVTTKKGRIGRPIVSYNLSTTFRQRPSYNDRAIDVMNSGERIRFSRDLVAQHYQFPQDMKLVGYEG